MSELNFAKTFLQTLDAKTTKYPSDHVFDPKTFATRIPFTLPKLPQPPHPPYPKSTPTAPPAPGATPTDPTISLTLKSSRNPALTLTLSDIKPSTTTIAQLKESVQSELGGSAVVAAEKIKILYNKKPVPASKKTVADVLEGEDLAKGESVDFGVMIMGGAPDPPSRAGAAPPAEVAHSGVEGVAEAPQAPPPAKSMEGIEKTSSPVPAYGLSGKEVLETDEFWTDLQGYLQQRLKDEAQAVRLVQKWKSSWQKD